MRANGLVNLGDGNWINLDRVTRIKEFRETPDADDWSTVDMVINDRIFRTPPEGAVAGDVLVWFCERKGTIYRGASAQALRTLLDEGRRLG